MASRLREAALAYAERGWPVLPLWPRKKNPLLSNGLLGASTDEAMIALWWDRWPDANIGLRTGVKFDVLDLDGQVGLDALSQKLGEWREHDGPISLTGRGEHWLFSPTGTANKAGMLEKVDWRGVNGYIVAPPSVHPSGSIYGWDITHDIDTPLPPAPEWLIGMLTPYVEYTPIAVIMPNPHDPLNNTVAAATAAGLQPRKRGNRFVLNCPFHEGDREASFTIYPDQGYHCYGCGIHGNSAYDFRSVLSVRRA